MRETTPKETILSFVCELGSHINFPAVNLLGTLPNLTERWMSTRFSTFNILEPESSINNDIRRLKKLLWTSRLFGILIEGLRMRQWWREDQTAVACRTSTNILTLRRGILLCSWSLLFLRHEAVYFGRSGLQFQRMLLLPFSTPVAELIGHSEASVHLFRATTCYIREEWDLL